MHTPRVSSRRSILTASIVALLSAAPAPAQSLFWDPLVDGDSAVGGSGIWNLTNLFWDGLGTDLAVDNVAWPNTATSVAIFSGTAGTVTINTGAGVTANGLTFNTSGYTLNSNVAADILTLAGTTPTVTVTDAGEFARINSVIAGTGFAATGAGTLILGGANTFTGQLQIGSGTTVALANLGVGAVAGGGVGNETIVASGATLNLGGQAYGNQAVAATNMEFFRIAGTGVGGVGALINEGAAQQNAISKLTLTGNATVNAGGSLVTSSNAAGQIVTSAGGRFDLRLTGTAAAGQNHLELGNFTLTKRGGSLFAIVNASVSNGHLVVDEGILNIEGTSLVQGTGSITVNPNGKLGFFSIASGANITRPINLNGGTIGDATGSSASQTINSPITILGALNPNFVAISNTTTLAGLIEKDFDSTITEFAKRGGATLALTNAGNVFDVPITIYAGNLQGNYPAFVGGVNPAAPVSLSGSPLGSAPSLTVAGGTLNIRVDGAGDATNQVFSIGKTITVDRAPGGINLDRVSAGSDKNLAVEVTFAPSSAANNYSIGQNQLTGVQGNGYRTQFTTLTMNNDTVLNAGDFTLTGNVLSANRNSLVHIGGNSWGFIGGTTQQFNATFNLGGTQLRIGSMFGTGVTNDTVTAGTGTIFNAPNATVSFRSPTNIAAGQTFELVSQQVAQSSVNLQNFTSVPTSLRARNSGVLAVGGATAFGDVDLSRIGDGTFRLGSNLGGTGNGTVTGVIAPGAGGVVRAGAAGTMIVSGTNRITGSAALEVGSDLINGGFRTSGTGGAQNGTVVLVNPNNYTGGTTVNRGSTLAFQNINSLGTGAVNVFGTITAEQVDGTFTTDGITNTFSPNRFGGSTLFFQNAALTGITDTNRWGDSEPVNLTASTLTLNSRNNNASTTLEKVGVVSYAGGSVINVNRQNAVVGNNVELDVDSFSRVGSGTLEIARSSGTGAGFGTANILKVLGTAPTPIALSTGTMLAPHITVVDGTRLVNFADYSPVSGIVNATPTNIVNTAAFNTGLTTGTEYVYADFAAAALTATLGDNPVIAALKVGAGQAAASATTIANGAGTSITIRTGGLIVSADTTAGFYSNAGGTQTTINPAINFIDGTTNIEGLINIRGGTTAILNGAITGSSLTKFGGGTLNLTANNAATIAGTVSLNGGTTQLFGPTVTGNHSPAGAGTLLLNGGQLNLRSNATTAVAYTLVNTGIAMAAGLPIATVDVNRGDGASTNLTLTINPAAAGPGLVLNGSPGAQGQTFNLIGGNGYALLFGNNAQNSFSGNVTIHTASANLTLNNNPVISGTNPVFTKSGGNLLSIGSNGGAPSVSPGTTVVVNDGTLEVRNVFTFGNTGPTTSLVLNRGTLNTRVDGDTTFGSTTPAGASYPVALNGNATISADRSGAAGSNSLHTLGKLTSTEGVTLTINSGNGYSLGFQGIQMSGTTFFTANLGPGDQNTAFRFLSGFDVAGGAVVKQGGGHLHLLNSNNSYDGGTYLQAGITRARAANAFGGGNIFLNPGATLDFNAADNMNGTQQLIVRGNGAFLPMISVNTNGVAHPTANVNTTGATTGIVGLSNGTGGSYDNAIDLSALYGGGWSLGGIGAAAYDPVYTGPSITAGVGNLYRLGGGTTSFAMGTDSARVARTNVLTGPNNVRLGFDSGTTIGGNTINFQFSIAGVNDYSGGSTVIHRGMVARLFSDNDGVRSGLSNSAVDVFGVLSLSGAASLSTGAVNTNAVTLHPGSALFLDNTNGAANNIGAFVAANDTDRWNDSTPIGLNGAMINLIGANNVTSTETVGDVTYSRGARLRAQRTGTGSTVLTLNNLLGGGAGNTVMIQTAGAGTLGGFDQIIVANNPPASVNGMVTPSIINATDQTFVTHGVTGFANVTYDNTFTAAGVLTAGLAPTAKVDINSAGTLTLGDNPVIYALRTNRDVNIGGPFTSLTLRSGGLIAQGNNLSIQPNLTFNDGASNIEARIYNSVLVNVNGTITANRITKFGTGALNINVPQVDYASGWTVNSGTLQINDLQGLGQSVPGNAVTINGALNTGGQASQAFGATQIIFNRNNGTAELFTFSGGPITVVNEGIVRIAAGDDRNLQIPEVILDSTSTQSAVGFTFDVPNNRFRGIIPKLTLNDDALIRVVDSGSLGDTGRITTGAITLLTGTNKNLTKIGNRTLELTGDNSASFTGGSITVSQGTVRVRTNGSLGSATTATTIERNATLEIDTPNFTAPGTVTQLPGSIERWNRQDARGTTYNLASGVNLQLNTNVLDTRTIGLNGGSIEGFLWIDNVAAAAERTLGSGVTVNLLADSLVGQNILQGQGYDAGRQPTVAQPFGDNITGTFLRIEGNITGAFDLTKTGLDTVTIAGTANTYDDTIVDMGVLRIGATNALPTGNTLTTRLGGAFDLYGNNQEVGGLGYLAAGPNPGGVGVGSSGRIGNSATTDNTLTVNSSDNYIYNGVIERNVGLTKAGPGTLVLGGSNTYVGDTNITAGTLTVTGSISGTKRIAVGSGATFDVSAASGGFTLGGTQTLLGNGTVNGAVAVNGNVAPGVGINPGIGTLTLNDAVTFNTNSTLSLEITGETTFDQLVANGVTLNGTVNLALDVTFTPTNAVSYLIVNNTSASPVSSFFTWSGPEGQLTEGESFIAGGVSFTISYLGGTGNDVLLTAVPEPGSISLFASALALLGFRRRRK